MPMWPFGRSKHGGNRSRVDPESVLEGKKPLSLSVDQRASTMPDSQRLGRRPSRRDSKRKRRSSMKKDIGPRDSSDFSPIDTNMSEKEKQPLMLGSKDNVAALPNHKEVGTGPHLRSVSKEQTSNTPYNYRQNSGSDSSIPTARERGKLQRPATLRSKRSTRDSGLPRRQSSKKRKDDHAREEEIRAMSGPVRMKRPATYSGGLFRRESKKMRSGANRHSTSEIQLPQLEESVHSSMSSGSEPRAFRISALDVFSPRPTIRLSYGASYSSGEHHHQPSLHNTPPRTGSRRARTPILDNDALKKSKRVDDLADTLDAGALREALERDKRRKEKKGRLDDEKLRLKLERRAEKLRLKELRREQKRLAKEQQQKTVGLGIEDRPSTPPEDKMVIDSVETQVQTLTNPFTDPPQPPQTPQSELPTPLPLESPFEEPVLATAQAVRYSQPNMSPPSSPTQHTRGPSNISQVAELSRIAPPTVTGAVRPAPTPPPESSHTLDIERRRSETPRRVSEATTTRTADSTTIRRASEASSRRHSGWTSFFRRGTNKKVSLDHGRTTPSEVSFSNTSRESMSRQPPPAFLQQQAIRRASGTPMRTRSIFREDLPELPLSPPDSRVQSPEATSSGAKAIAARRGYQQPANIKTGHGSPARNGSLEDTTQNARTDSPVSPNGRASALMSQSLASIDSEGSWLSGKPVKRSPAAAHRQSAGSGQVSRHAEEFNASYEELGIPDDEYFRRLTPQPDDHRKSTQSGIARKASSTAIASMRDPDSEGEEEPRNSPTETSAADEIIHSTVARQPTVVRHNARVKSREGLLNEFHPGDESPESSPIGGSTDKDSPTDDMPSPEPGWRIERAQSIDLGKRHSRQLSAGSAKLLDIPKSKRNSPNQSRRPSRTSQTSQP